ncbi:hypothetical protein [Arachidicoccus sp.]|uniref:hypothetical protein n=1 Tax=Arachidicoccus sp. TaxID=1872624 RepID=UPI003D1D3721
MRKILLATVIIFVSCHCGAQQLQSYFKFRCKTERFYFLDNSHSFAFCSDKQDTSFICTLDLNKNKFTDYSVYPAVSYDIVSKASQYSNSKLKLDFIKYAMINPSGKDCGLRIAFTLDENGNETVPVYIYIDYPFLGMQYLAEPENE